MLLLQSFFSWQGFEQRGRFALVQAVCYLLFTLNAIYSQQVLLFTLLLLVLAMLSWCSNLKRVADTELKQNRLALTSVALLIISLVSFISNNTTLLWLFICPLLITLYLITIPAPTTRDYVIGYSGTLDLSHYQTSTKQYKQRVEPVLSFELNHADVATKVEQVPLSVKPKSQDKQAQSLLFNQLWQKLSGVIAQYQALYPKQNILMMVGISCLALLLGLFAMHWPATQQANNGALNQPLQVAPTRLSPLLMPDNFSLMMTEQQGLYISWPAPQHSTEPVAEQLTKQLSQNHHQLVWSQVTTLGDASCQHITFNDNSKIRTLDVVLEQGQHYFAAFSPLDTKALLQAIAFRGSFNLCAHQFSLSGSQVALGKHRAYADYIDY